MSILKIYLAIGLAVAAIILGTTPSMLRDDSALESAARAAFGRSGMEGLVEAFIFTALIVLFWPLAVVWSGLRAFRGGP